jgi:hypothetical protein
MGNISSVWLVPPTGNTSRVWHFVVLVSIFRDCTFRSHLVLQINKHLHNPKFRRIKQVYAEKLCFCHLLPFAPLFSLPLQLACFCLFVLILPVVIPFSSRIHANHLHVVSLVCVLLKQTWRLVGRSRL